jgi:hypothetical protein
MTIGDVVVVIMTKVMAHPGVTRVMAYSIFQRVDESDGFFLTKEYYRYFIDDNFQIKYCFKNYIRMYNDAGKSRHFLHYYHHHHHRGCAIGEHTDLIKMKPRASATNEP